MLRIPLFSGEERDISRIPVSPEVSGQRSSAKLAKLGATPAAKENETVIGEEYGGI